MACKSQVLPTMVIVIALGIEQGLQAGIVRRLDALAACHAEGDDLACLSLIVGCLKKAASLGLQSG